MENDKIYTFPNTEEAKDIALEVLKSFIGPELPEIPGMEDQARKLNKLTEDLKTICKQ